MKDAYSFDRDEEGLRRSYQVMYEAYERVFDRCGLDYVVVEAEPGQIGGGVNHEFMARADVGEDLFVECANGDYLADMEAATPRAARARVRRTAADAAREGRHAGRRRRSSAVSELLGVPAERTLKTMLFDAGGRRRSPSCVPGDREVSEEKLERVCCSRAGPAGSRTTDFAARGFVKGYVGPQGLGDDVHVLADHSVRGGGDWVTGANESGPPRHRGERRPRLPRGPSARTRRAPRGRPLPGRRRRARGSAASIVVGHIYQLGTRYSAPLEAHVPRRGRYASGRTRWGATASGSRGSWRRRSSSTTTRRGCAGRRRWRRSTWW